MPIVSESFVELDAAMIEASCAFENQEKNVGAEDGLEGASDFEAAVTVSCALHVEIDGDDMFAVDDKNLGCKGNQLEKQHDSSARRSNFEVRHSHQMQSPSVLAQ